MMRKFVVWLSKLLKVDLTTEKKIVFQHQQKDYKLVEVTMSVKTEDLKYREKYVTESVDQSLKKELLIKMHDYLKLESYEDTYEREVKFKVSVFVVKPE